MNRALAAQGMDEDIDYWLQLAHLDLESARGSLRGDSYLHCIFGCQQALEKGLKALVVAATEKAPPRIHNLVRLAALHVRADDAEQAVAVGVRAATIARAAGSRRAAMPGPRPGNPRF